jgi:hypothetical protein
MTSRILLCGVLVLVAMPAGTRTSERLVMRVSPSVAFAPADLVVSTTIDSNASNRAIEIIAESADFYRSSEVPLDGDKAPRTFRLALRNLPGGAYTVRALLKGANDQQLAQTRQEINIVSAASDR